MAPAGSWTTIADYNNSLPLITSWSILTSPTAPITSETPPNSALLTELSPLTRWQFSWFLLTDSNGEQTEGRFMMGIDNFSAPCGTTPVNEFQSGTNTPTQAFWYYLPSTNETTILFLQY